jgi:hypothetical protein
MREGGHQFSKVLPVGGRASDLLAENLLATGCLELRRRAGEVLRFRRDAGIAVNHYPDSGTEFRNRKAKPYQRLGLFQISCRPCGNTGGGAAGRYINRPRCAE